MKKISMLINVKIIGHLGHSLDISCRFTSCNVGLLFTFSIALILTCINVFILTKSTVVTNTNDAV